MRKEFKTIIGNGKSEVFLKGTNTERDMNFDKYKEYLLLNKYSDEVLLSLYDNKKPFNDIDFKQILNLIENKMYRKLLYLKFDKNLQLKDIANEAGLTERTARRKLKKAIDSLRKTLRPLYLNKLSFNLGQVINEKRKTSCKVIENYKEYSKPKTNDITISDQLRDNINSNKDYTINKVFYSRITSKRYQGKTLDKSNVISDSKKLINVEYKDIKENNKQFINTSNIANIYFDKYYQRLNETNNYNKAKDKAIALYANYSNSISFSKYMNKFNEYYSSTH